MEHDQNILPGTRAACETAILLIWIVEALFLLIAFLASMAAVFGVLESQFADYSVVSVVLTSLIAAFLSFVITSIAVASLASAVANIDARNIQFEQLQMLREREKQEYVLPVKTRRSKRDVDVMRIRPERVT